MLGSPLSYIRKQTQAVSSIYLQLEGEKFLALLEERLRTHEISWNQVVESQKKPVLIDTISFNIPGYKNPTPYEARLFLSKTNLQTQDKSSYGTVKAVVQLYKGKSKKKKEYQSHVTLFVAKKQMQVSDKEPKKEVL